MILVEFLHLFEPPLCKTFMKWASLFIKWEYHRLFLRMLIWSLRGWESACHIVGAQQKAHKKFAAATELCLSSCPWRPLTGRRGSYFCIGRLLRSEQTEGLVRVDNTTRFCQISQPFCEHVFVRGDTKPSQKFPELLQELWPGPEGRAYPLC